MFLRTLKLKYYLMLLIVLLFSISIGIPNTFAQENICRTGLARNLEYGVPLNAEIDDDLSPFEFFCFEAERGDSVTVTISPIEGAGNLIPWVAITKSVAASITIEEMLSNSISGNIGDTAMEAISATAEIDADGQYLIVVSANERTEGRYEILLEVEESQSLLGGGSLGGMTVESTEESSVDETTPTGEPSDLNTDNLCELEGVDTLEMGTRLTIPFTETTTEAFFCFEGTAGDLIQIEVGTASGDVLPAAILLDPIATDEGNIMYAQDLVETPDDVIQIVQELPTDGQYLVGVLSINSLVGEVYLQITSSAQATADFGCQSEPLSTLSKSQWGLNIDGEQDLNISYNISCIGVIIMQLFGSNTILEYGVTTDGDLVFTMGDSQFVTLSVDEDVWVLQNPDGEEITLSRLDSEICSQDIIAELIHGAWRLDAGGSEVFLIDFMCNGVAFLLNQNTPIVAYYTFEDGVLELSGPSGQVLLTGEVTVTGELMTLVSEATGEVPFVNILSDSAELPDG